MVHRRGTRLASGAGSELRKVHKQQEKGGVGKPATTPFLSTQTGPDYKTRGSKIDRYSEGVRDQVVERDQVRNPEYCVREGKK